MSDQDGILLARRLRELARSGKLHVSVIATLRGFQANYVHGSNTATVDIRDDPVKALLVATGAVHTHDMNTRNRNQFSDLLG